MKKILFFLPYMVGGGAQRVFINLLRAMSKKKYELILVVIDKNGPYLSMVPKEVELVELKANRVLGGIKELKELFRFTQPNVIISGLNYANIATIIAAKWARVSSKIIITEHNNYSMKMDKSNQMRRLFFYQLIKWTYKYADNIVCVSKGVAYDLRNTVGLKVKEHKIIVINNPVVDDSLNSKSEVIVRHQWLDDPNIKIIISMGRLTDQKDFPTLINAYAKAKMQTTDIIKLLILGEGEKRSELEQQIKSLNLDHEVLMPGFVDNPFPYLAKADLFVLTSKWEGFGNVIVEAMACGLPVIATNCPYGPDEIIKDKENGLLVPVGDNCALADSIKVIMTDDDLRSQIINNAKRSVEKYVVENIALEYEAVF